MVSVVMTTYNGEKYLLEQLESLRTQSMQIDEVLISDDGSTDNTASIVSSYIENYHLNNWIFKVNAQNKGWRRNFVDTASEANGDYILFCDQDDIWVKNKIETMVSTMQKNPKIDVLAGRYIKFDDKIPNVVSQNNGAHIVKDGGSLLYTELPGCVYCVKTSFWKRIIKQWNGIFSHDAICWATAKLLGTAFVLEMPVIYWRNHGDSAYAIASRNLKDKTSRIDWLTRNKANVECLREIINEYNLSNDVISRINEYQDFLQLRIEMMEHKRIVNCIRLLKRLELYDRKRQYLLEISLMFK